MSIEDEATVELLEDVERIHPALDRLRELVASVTILDLKASAGSYWAEHRDGDGPLRQAESA